MRQEFEDYLKCGVLEHGFLRVKCGGCRHEHLVAFSCKRRGFCPSCGARRMVESAAHLVDHVFPEVPIRQYVLTFPIPLRFLLAAQPDALTQVLAVVQRGISTFVVQHSGLTVSSGARTGAVTLIQRFGSALNLNPHLHMLFLDGAYTFRGCGAVFHRARRLTDIELAHLLDSLSRRIVRLLERRGLLIADPEPPQLDFEPGSSLDQIQAASVQYRIAVGPHAGRKALSLYSVPPLQDQTPPDCSPRWPVSHCTLRPCAKRISDQSWNACAVTLPARIVPHRPRGKVDNDKPTAPMNWMQRLKRVFEIDIETCPDCGGKLRVIASIQDPPLIAKILGHVQQRAALIARLARGPPAESISLPHLT